MALTEDRFAAIAVLVLLDKMESDGIELKPKEIRRKAIDGAKKLDIPVAEAAEFLKATINMAHAKAIAELNKLIAGLK